MFQFIGYDFYSDGNALNNAPSAVSNIIDTKLTNGIFDHLNLTKNTNIVPSTNIPQIWDYDTILNADFDGNLNAGNIDFLISQITSIKIKRRVKGTFDWIVLTQIPINSIEDLTFVFTDRLNANETEYEYAFVPMLLKVIILPILFCLNLMVYLLVIAIAFISYIMMCLMVLINVINPLGLLNL